MKKTWKRLCTGFLALATVVTALPTTPVHAESKQYWTESKERVGIVEKVMNDGSIGSTFNEGHLTVEGEDAYCSGLVQWCYGKAGISLPRTAQAQYDATQHLPLSQAKAGDLVFFHSTYNAGSYVILCWIYPKYRVR